MMISHKYKFIFFRIHKTASTSLQFALSNISGPDDIISPFHDKLIDNSKYSKNNWYDENRKVIFYNHIPAYRVKELLSEKHPNIWDSYFKFCFERNPWDKAMSLFYFYNQRGPWTREALHKFIMHSDGNYQKNMSEWHIYTDKKEEKIIIDKVFKYEEMDESIKYLIKKCNFPKNFSLPDHKYKSQFRLDHRDYREIFTEEEKTRIHRWYKSEIKEFGYDF